MSITSLVDKKLVFVAMSGGVDSSVAAALLKKRGFSVVGVFFKPWQPEQGSGFRVQGSGDCTWEQDRLDAMRVCAKLEVPFKTWDFSHEYGKLVAQYMIDSYRAGITPNPDVMCNKEIKFGLFLKKALTEGADFIATGHYAQLTPGMTNSKLQITNQGQNLKSKIKLLKGKDKNKDQSYFLWMLNQKQLEKCLFPIGEYTKPEVRKLAQKFGLPNHAKKDSQGVCFVGQLDMKEFLKNYIKPKPGKIILLDAARSTHSVRSGRVVGQHDGAYYYTIGQRHGLDIKNGGGPYFVSAKNIKKNIVYVTRTEKDLMAKQTAVSKINWIGAIPEFPSNVQIKIRYRSESVPAVITGNGKDKNLLIKFKKPVRAITPGQSAVFYREQEIMGGGIII